MKLLLTFLAWTLCFQHSYSQNSTFDSSAMLKETSEKVCKCIDKIKYPGMTTAKKAAAVKKCINDDVMGYMLTKKLMASMNKDTGMNRNIEINMNEDSKDYRLAYYDIEKYCMDNCASLRKIVASNDDEANQSMTDNSDAKKQYNKGIELVKKDDYANALPYFKKTVELDENFAFAWDNLGLCYRKTGDYDNALNAYKRSLAINPKGNMPLHNIPVVYEFKKEYDNAIKAYTDLLAVFPDDPETYYGVGRVYTYFLNDYEKGLQNMCKAYNLYIKINSPYRADADKTINYIYHQMKKDGKEKQFKDILKDNNINAD
jgi:tetratricopeptide (TPR) repeat protein